MPHLSYAAAPIPFPVGTDLVDKHVHFVGALILLMVLEGGRHLQGDAVAIATGWCGITGLFCTQIF